MRPTFLDLAKAQRPLGVLGKWRCPLCPKVISWCCDLKREIEVSEEVPSHEYLQAVMAGFTGRVQQEIEQHLAEAHPPGDS